MELSQLAIELAIEPVIELAVELAQRASYRLAVQLLVVPEGVSGQLEIRGSATTGMCALTVPVRMAPRLSCERNTIIEPNTLPGRARMQGS